jgi:signal transduction histidine kinase
MYLLDSGMTKGEQDRVKEGMEIIKMIVGRTRKFVLDILHFAKQQDLKWEHVDVISFAQEVSSAIEMKAEAQGIELRNDFDLSLGEFEVDASVVQSALLNILENAIDACLEDQEKKDHRIFFRVQQDPSYIIFEVEDNGIGIEGEAKENLFNLSFSSKGSKGTGMGLFITNNIIKQHGGTITVDSAPGEWTRFRIEIPKEPAEVQPELVQSSPSPTVNEEK